MVTPTGYPPNVGLVPTERVDGAGDFVAVHCTSSSGVPVKVVFFRSREENSLLIFFKLNILFFFLFDDFLFDR